MKKAHEYLSLSMTHALKKAGHCNVATGNIDLAATILDAALGRPNHGNGTSLLKHYVNNNNPKRDRIHSTYQCMGARTGL